MGSCSIHSEHARYNVYSLNNNNTMSQGKYGEKREEYKTNYKYAIIIKVKDMSQYNTQKVILKKYIIL